MSKLCKQFLLSGIQLRRFAQNQPISYAHRKYSSSSYEGDGKTKVKVLNNDMEMGLMINSYSEVIFVESPKKMSILKFVSFAFRLDFD